MAAQGHDDRDDWFADENGEPVLESDPVSSEDDWFVPVPRVERTRPLRERTRTLVIGGAGVAVLLAILAAAGVFSSGGSPKPRPIVTTPPRTPVTTTPATHTKPVPALPTATLKPGDTGTQVKKLQRALKALGYSVGTIDGQYGPTTKEAVASFQHDAKLTADGVFGPKTLNALIRKAGP